MLRYLLTLGGLVLFASPLGAQQYIDLEAERHQQQTDTTVSAPVYGAPNVAQTESPVEASSAVVTAGPQNPAISEMYSKLQTLQQEVRELRGLVEEQAYELRQLKQQSLERYVDVDRRLSGGETAKPVAPGNTPTTATTKATTSPQVQEKPGEADAYRKAYSLVRSQQFVDAVSAFRQFVQDYPQGKYAPNAHYWLGELFLVIVPPDLEASRREFTLLIEQYTDNSKIPDALYKLGKVYFDKGDAAKAREYFDRVINEYGKSGSSAVKLARDFISQNY